MAPTNFGQSLQMNLASSRVPPSYRQNTNRSRAPVPPPATTNGSVASQNWRTNAAPAGTGGAQTNPNPLAVTVTAATTARTRGAFLRIAQRGSSPSQWDIGDIVEVPHLGPTLNPRETNADYKIPTPVGNICPKVRKAIVIAKYPERMIVLPMYSSGGNGLQYKPSSYQLTAMSVTNPADVRPATAKLLAPDRLYVEDRWMPNPGTHICVNEPLTVTYGWPIAPKSRLDVKSIELVKKRYQFANAIGFRDLVSQENYYRQQIAEDNRKPTVLQPKQQSGQATSNTQLTSTTKKTNGTAWNKV